jgi:hypothetical protein
MSKEGIFSKKRGEVGLPHTRFIEIIQKKYSFAMQRNYGEIVKKLCGSNLFAPYPRM